VSRCRALSSSRTSGRRVSALCTCLCTCRRIIRNFRAMMRHSSKTARTSSRS
jgi:hypothetical protein